MYQLYHSGTSLLHNTDPRIKLVAVSLFSASILLFKNLFIIAFVLMLLHVLILGSGIPLHKLGWIWKSMLPLNVLVPLMWVIFYPEGHTLLQVGLFRLTDMGIVQGVALALRLDVLAFAFFSLLFTTDQTKLIRGLVRLGLPYPWGLTLAIALRYIPTFYGQYILVSHAQQARGLDMQQGSIVRRLRAFLPILVAMVVNALRMSDNLSMTLQNRAFGTPGVERTYRVDLALTRCDYALLVLIILAMLFVVYVRFGLGVGLHPYHVW